MAHLIKEQKNMAHVARGDQNLVISLKIRL